MEDNYNSTPQRSVNGLASNKVTRKRSRCVGCTLP